MERRRLPAGGATATDAAVAAALAAMPAAAAPDATRGAGERRR